MKKLFFSLAIILCSSSIFARDFVITDYGAVSGSDKVQTKKIQKAINAAARKGGTVVIPKGEFRSGALFFKKGTHLHLEEGAVLVGSDTIADYPLRDVHIEGVIQKYYAALINAYGVDGFSITGPGKIDGNGEKYWKAFWARKNENPKCTNLEVSRPRMIYICNSKNIKIQGVRLYNSGFWTTHLYKCENIEIEGVKIRAPYKPVKAPSSDGIDLDACKNVHIDNCDISVADDIISLKGGKGPWADKDPDNGTNENILVENCSFGRGPGVLVFGSECIGAKNVVMRNCRVDGADRLLWLKMRPDTPQRYEDVLVENVTGKVGRMLYIKPWTQFFDLKGCKEIPLSYANNITIRGCHLNCKEVKAVKEDPSQYILTNIDVDDNYIRPEMPYNKDESKVGPYSLEDPLRFVDGREVTAANWPERRKEILEIFQEQMFGRMPEASPIYMEEMEAQKSDTISGGTVLRRRMWFNKEHSGTHVDWMYIVPNNLEGKKCPAFLMLNYYGNEKILANKGNKNSVFPIKDILKNGYAFVTARLEDISPDSEYFREQEENAFTGIFDLWDSTRGQKVLNRAPNATGALAAWGWVMMRGVDMLQESKMIDGKEIFVTGSSRAGKAALLAAAFDERIKGAIINQAGGGGITLAKRNLGESIKTEVTIYTHWYCPNYNQYADKEQTMPFDQHLLASCIAPRALLVEGFNNPWFDTLGEFKSLQAASPVWEMMGVEGLPKVDFPADDDTKAMGKYLGYVRRSGAHGYYPSDWVHILDFTNRILCK